MTCTCGRATIKRWSGDWCTWCHRTVTATTAAALTVEIPRAQLTRKCDEPGCGFVFPYHGTGRPSRYCPAHRTKKYRRRPMAQAIAS